MREGRCSFNALLPFHKHTDEFKGPEHEASAPKKTSILSDQYQILLLTEATGHDQHLQGGYFLPSPVTLCHKSRSPPKVRHASELNNSNDCPASTCTSEICMDSSTKLQLYCIVNVCLN